MAQAPGSGSIPGPMALLHGTVKDHSGVPIPEAIVTATNLSTGQNNSTRSNPTGEFEIADLASGVYQLQVSRTGFQTRASQRLTLTAGQPVTVALLLEQSSGTQSQTSPGREAGAAESSSANVSNAISESQLAGLPLNGRSYSQLATLQGAVSSPFAASASRGVGGGGLSVAGGRSTSNTFLLDGTNIMDASNRVPRSAAGVQLGSDTIFRVRVYSTTYSAEYGRGSGGVLNSITRSGTPEWHGSFFEYFRNSKLDARNFFDPGAEPTPFKRNQFGFALTGPVRKDTTFFMASFEGMRDRLTETSVDFFPNALARQGIITDATGKEIRRVSVSPRVKPFLDLYPMPNLGPTGNGVNENRTSVFLPTSENFLTIRLDHKISGRDSLFVRYTFDDAASHSTQPMFLFRRLSESRQQYFTLVASHVASPQVVHSFRFGFTRPVANDRGITSIDLPESSFFVQDAPEFGMLSVAGISPFGFTGGTPLGKTMGSFQFAYDILAQKASHALKLGVQAHLYRWSTFTNFNRGARWSFSNLESFLNAGADGTTKLDVSLPGSDNKKFFRQTLLGFYVQDDYQVASRIQLNLGLRYEFTSLIREKSERTSALLDVVRGSDVQIGPLIANNPSLLNFAPRIGFTWSPGASGNAVLSGGFGIYYDQLLEYLVDQVKNTLPFFKQAVRTNFDSSTTFPDAVAAAQGVSLMARTLDYRNTSTTMVFRYNLALQHRLANGWNFRSSYVGARGNHLFRTYETNLFPVPVTRPDGSLFLPPNEGPVNPAFGSIVLINSDAQSFYNSLQFSAQKSFSRGSSLRANYTWSKSIDDTSRHTFGSVEQYGPERTLDRALSDFDVRHRLVTSYFFVPPLGSGMRFWNSGILKHLFGGWRIGGIVSLRAGAPFSPGNNVRTPEFLFTPSRPNLLPGQSLNPTEGVTAGCTGIPTGQRLGTRERYFDPCVYAIPEPGTLGNAGRNTIISPSVFNMDISLQKAFPLDSRIRLQFRTEFFNLLNHTNLDPRNGPPPFVFTGRTGRRNPIAGRIVGTTTTSRQIQFALRLSF